MENIGGIFVVLICGLIIAVFVAIMEFVWSTRRSAETDEVCPHTCPRRPHRHTPVGSHGISPALLIISLCVRKMQMFFQLLPFFVHVFCDLLLFVQCVMYRCDKRNVNVRLKRCPKMITSRELCCMLCLF